AALIEAEDRRFSEHRGIDFPAAARAFLQNSAERRIVSGASTITMQTIRLMRRGKKRTLPEKALEGVLALRLELSYTKDEILALYADNAPFGANVVGLEAASRRWFGRASGDLSWSEAALLAVLPNGPSLIHPGRNRDALGRKRDALLEKLCARGLFDGETLALAKAESLPGEPLPLPDRAPHLLVRKVLEAGGAGAFNSRSLPASSGLYGRTTVDYSVQERANTILNRWSALFARRGIMNGACVILDTPSGETLAYVGNTVNGEAAAVDIAAAPRSSGSLLKPFLYAAMLDGGYLLPSSLVSDIPTRVGSYSPENNSRAYLGVIPADEALARSLNVPAVRNLRQYGVEPFAELLKSLGFTTLFRDPEEYGLPLILGGAEVKLWETARIYAELARTAGGETGGPLSPGAAWLTLEALSSAVRPGEEAPWREYAGSRRIAWKTGTSFGNRDAWAVGVSPAWTVAVWIGNASGEGRAELVSSLSSAPVLFELFSALDSTGGPRGGKNGDWFPRPEGALDRIEACGSSGFPAGPDCAEIKYVLAPAGAPSVRPCPYCRRVVLNEGGESRALVRAGSAEPVRELKWFVLPPAEEWYYRRWNLDYKPLPPLSGGGGTVSMLALFNPEEDGAVYIPRELDGREGRIVFQAAHRDQGETIFWHLDGDYMGATRVFHDLEARPGPGFHTLTLVDGGGGRLSRRFEVLSGAD
ncbi:MAG: penicillin-binding protein 1C, partial [Treponema sp.]|nr:penicillin-binding protein 1C [Treponema sp.]